MYVYIIDLEGKVLVHNNIKMNDFYYFSRIIDQCRSDLTIASESTFNWYWLSDACRDNGIDFVLGHALYMKAIHGTKTRNNRID